MLWIIYFTGTIPAYIACRYMIKNIDKLVYTRILRFQAVVMSLFSWITAIGIGAIILAIHARKCGWWDKEVKW